jgi:hypothetical protein
MNLCSWISNAFRSFLVHFLGEQKMNKANFKTKKVTMGSAPIKENLPYFCPTKQQHNAKQLFHL